MCQTKIILITVICWYKNTISYRFNKFHVLRDASFFAWRKHSNIYMLGMRTIDTPIGSFEVQNLVLGCTVFQAHAAITTLVGKLSWLLNEAIAIVKCINLLQFILYTADLFSNIFTTFQVLQIFKNQF